MIQTESKALGVSPDTSLVIKADKLVNDIVQKTQSVEEKLDKATDKYLQKLQQQEMRLQKNIFRKDSTLAKQLFGGVEAKYAVLKNAPQN